MSSDENQRIGIVNEDKCKPKKCRQECKRSCPVVMMGECTAAARGGGLQRLLGAAERQEQASAAVKSV